MMYKVLRNILFLFPPESVHYFSMNTLKWLCRIGFIKRWITAAFRPEGKELARELFGLHFKNGVGLGAGFDKNARYLNELEALGFGFVEIGTVTPLPQEGNEKPRLFRLSKDNALINRMGFNNDGVKIIAARLREWNARQANQTGRRLIIGGNIGKNKITSNEDAWKDYETCFRGLFEEVDYFVVNVSSPNTPGLRELQKGSLLKILSHLQTINQQQASPKPLLLKIAPDLTHEQLDDIVDLARTVKLSGIVATNTTITRNLEANDTATVAAIGAGGLSGQPVKTMSTAIVRYLYGQLKGEIPIIASGGIFTAADAREKTAAGAALVQVWTGFIYEGPGIVKQILAPTL
jgi:dihydroorotate dehydrogenase